MENSVRRNVSALSKMQSKKSAKKWEQKKAFRAAEAAKSNLQKIKETILILNDADYSERKSVGLAMVDKIATKAVGQNDFITSVADSVMRYERASEKQAYVLARFADENDIYA